MDELIKMVAQKSGISEDQARTATQTVIDYLKSKLPAPVAGQIDGILGAGCGLGNMAQGLGGMFGKK